MPTLRLLSPASLPKIGSEIHFDAESVTIGSRPPADLVLREPSVSKLHARLTRRPGGFLLVDLGSENGLSIGQTRVLRTELDYRQLFRVGRVVLELLPDEGVQFKSTNPSEPPVFALDPPAHRERVTSGATSNGLAWLVSVVAAAVTASLFLALQWKVKSQATATTLSDAGSAKTQLLTLRPGDPSRQIRVDGTWALRVPSAAVTADVGVAVTLIGQPRGPKTPLLVPNGPGLLVEFAERSALRQVLEVNYTNPEGLGSLNLLGRYEPAQKRFGISASSDKVYRLTEHTALLVPLKLGKSAKMRQVGPWAIVFDEHAVVEDERLVELGLRLDVVRSAYEAFRYPLTESSVVLLEEKSLSKKAPLCSSYLTLPVDDATWNQSQLEQGLFAVVLSHSVDCERAIAAQRVLMPLARSLARSSDVWRSDAASLPRPLQYLGLYAAEPDTLDVTSEFFAFLTRDSNAKRLLLEAIATRLSQLSLAKRPKFKAQLAVVAAAVEDVTGQSLAVAWQAYVAEVLLPAFKNRVARDNCPSATQLDLAYVPNSLRARLSCAPLSR